MLDWWFNWYINFKDYKNESKLIFVESIRFKVMV